MPAATVQIILTPGTGQAPVFIQNNISQETGAVMTATIEKPTEIGNFQAPDVTLKGYDPTGVIQGLLLRITPTSKDFNILISMSVNGQSDVLFDGFINPSSVTFNDIEKSFSFTVFGQGRRLQTTSADGMFQRPGYFDAKWSLYTTASPDQNIISVIGINGLDSDFVKGDELQVTGVYVNNWAAGNAGGDTFTVVNVALDTSALPSTVFQVTLSGKPSQAWAANTVVLLLTKCQRNLALESVVSQLFAAAGFPNEQYFANSALPNLVGQFLSPLNPTGLQGTVLGIGPSQAGNYIWVVTTRGLYAASSTSGGFSIVLANVGNCPPVDPSNILPASGARPILGGPKRTRVREGTLREGITETMTFYGYDYSKLTAPFKRYALIVTYSTIRDASGLYFPYAIELHSQLSNDGFTWGQDSLLWSGENGLTRTLFASGYDALGIEVDPLTGNVFFTDMTTNGGTQLSTPGPAGTALQMNISTYVVAPIFVGLTRNVYTSTNGPLVLSRPTTNAIFLNVFQVDGILGIAPNVTVFRVLSSGTLILVNQTPISPYVIGRTFKYNQGDGFWYGLISDFTQGIQLVCWSADFFATTRSIIPLAPPPPRSAQATNFYVEPYELDLFVFQGNRSNGDGTWPMIANVGGQIMLVSNQSSGVVELCDTSGLSVADALGQLAVMNAGIFHLTQNGNRWLFRTRNAPMPGNTIATNDQIDAPGITMAISKQAVFNNWLGYVSVQNENDDTIFGDAGDIAFAQSVDTSLSLALQSRFVTSSNFCKALATSLLNYLGAQKRWIQVIVQRDGRHVYEIGRTFHCVVDGANRQFQILGVQNAVFGISATVSALEV